MIGEFGFDIINVGETENGNWNCIEAYNVDAVIDTSSSVGDDEIGVTLIAGEDTFGVYTSITVLSGKVKAYRSEAVTTPPPSGTSCSYRLDKPSSEYLDFAAQLDSTLTGTAPQWTQVLVFKRRSVSNVDADVLLSKWAGSGNQRSYRLQIETNNRLRFDYTNDGLTPVTFTANSIDTLTSVSDFYFLAIRFDGTKTVSAEVFDFYLGGTGVISKTVPTDLESGGTHNIFMSTATNKLGALTNGAGTEQNYLNALVNQYYVFNTIVDDATLNNLFNSGTPLEPTGTTGLVHNYQCNDTWNGTEFDVLDSEGTGDGVSINLSSDDLICE